jgi:hypothetical protein
VPEQPVDFSGVHLKLARAGRHLDALRAKVEAFRAREPIGFRHTTEPGDDGSEVHQLWAQVREQPPVEWSVIIGDVLHNLRSALDHAVWAMADPADRYDRAQFPIYSSEEDYRRNADTLLRGVSPRRRELIEGEQPFRWPEESRHFHHLAALRQMSNDDKHRILRPIAMVPDLPAIHHDGADIDVKWVAFGRMLRDGDEIMRFVVQPPAPVDPFVSFEIAVEGTIGAMLDVLGNIGRIIQYEVIAPLEHPDAYTYLPLPPPSPDPT